MALLCNHVKLGSGELCGRNAQVGSTDNKEAFTGDALWNAEGFCETEMTLWLSIAFFPFLVISTVSCLWAQIRRVTCAKM